MLTGGCVVSIVGLIFRYYRRSGHVGGLDGVALQKSVIRVYIGSQIPRARGGGRYTRQTGEEDDGGGDPWSVQVEACCLW